MAGSARSLVVVQSVGGAKAGVGASWEGWRAELGAAREKNSHVFDLSNEIME